VVSKSSGTSLDSEVEEDVVVSKSRDTAIVVECVVVSASDLEVDDDEALDMKGMVGIASTFVSVCVGVASIVLDEDCDGVDCVEKGVEVALISKVGGVDINRFVSVEVFDNDSKLKLDTGIALFVSRLFGFSFL